MAIHVTPTWAHFLLNLFTESSSSFHLHTSQQLIFQPDYTAFIAFITSIARHGSHSFIHLSDTRADNAANTSELFTRQITHQSHRP